MSDLPERGERIQIAWPGGPHNFVMDFDCEPDGWPAPTPGWRWLSGRIVEPEDPGWAWRTLYARATADGWEMLPADRPTL